MAFEDLDAGDETRRDGDHIAFPHPDGDGTALDSVTIAQGRVVTYDGTDLAEVTGDDTDTVAGVLQNYDVSGDTGSEVVGPDATVGTQGAYKADLTAYADNGTGVTVAEGNAVGPNGEIYIAEAIDAANNLYEVVVR